MAREFSKSEIIRQKCSICGGKNKKFTEIINGGYKLTCCNCGHINTFFNSNESILSYTNGREICIQVTTCNHKSCKYYCKYTLHQSSKILDNILKGLDTGCIYDNNIDINCKCCEYSNTCPNNTQNSNQSESKNKIKNSDSYQLDINGYKYNNPKFH